MNRNPSLFRDRLFGLSDPTSTSSSGRLGLLEPRFDETRLSLTQLFGADSGAPLSKRPPIRSVLARADLPM